MRALKWPFAPVLRVRNPDGDDRVVELVLEGHKEVSMSVIRLARIVGAAGVIAAVPFIAVTAQTQSPPPSSTSPPAATKPETSASPTAPQVNPSFLGFGGHIVAIPNGKFDRVGDTVQINMTADEVNKLPKAKTQK